MRCCNAICFLNNVVMAIKTKRYRCDTYVIRCDEAMLTERSKWWAVAIYIKYQIALEHWSCCMTTVQCNLVTVAISWHNLTQHEKTFLCKVQAWFLSMSHQRDIVKKIVLHCWRHHCFYVMFESRVSIIGIVIWVIYLSIITLKTATYCIRFDQLWRLLSIPIIEVIFWI